jgi:lipopolysaccharide transport system permease protein
MARRRKAAGQGRQHRSKDRINMNNSEKWDNIISNKRSLFELQLGEVWRYRDLIWLFFRRDFVSTYKQTILGPLWFVIQPLASTVMYTLVFGQIAKLPTQGLPPFIFYMSGIILWGLFASCLSRCSSVFTTNASIFSKVYFPRLTVPISSVMSAILTFLIQMAVFIVFMIYFAARGNDIKPGIGLLITPIITIEVCLLGIGFGCIISSLTTRYRDLQMALGFGMQLWMYGSCIFYSRSSVPPNLLWILNLNPLVPLVENFRNAFLGSGAVNYYEIMYSMMVSLGVFTLGAIIFHQVEKDFADTI